MTKLILLFYNKIIKLRLLPLNSLINKVLIDQLIWHLLRLPFICLILVNHDLEYILQALIKLSLVNCLYFLVSLLSFYLYISLKTKDYRRSLILIYLIWRLLSNNLIFLVALETLRNVSELYEFFFLRGTLDRHNFSIINRKIDLEDKFSHLLNTPGKVISHSDSSIENSYQRKSTILRGRPVEFVEPKDVNSK